MGSNALASYIVLAVAAGRKMLLRPIDAHFVARLKRELPAALSHLQQGNVAPVDFAQAAIGPGMAVYSRYGRILDKRPSYRGAHRTGTDQPDLTEVLS